MSFYLEEAVTTPVSEDGFGNQVVFGISSVQGWRGNQEDAHIAIGEFALQNSALFAIFDGHNGGEVAQYAAKLMPDILKKSEKMKDGKIREGLEQAFVCFDAGLMSEEAQEDMRNIRKEIHPRLNDFSVHIPAFQSGCTAVVALVYNNQLFVANAGDSRCVVCKNGKAMAMSKDHKPTHKKERIRIQRAGGKVESGVINNDIALSRAFGDHEYKANKQKSDDKQMIIAYPDVRLHQLTREDEFMVLACDGVFDCMSNQELVNFVKKRIDNQEKLSKICEEIFEHCLPKKFDEEVPGTDNMTCIIVKFNLSDNL